MHLDRLCDAAQRGLCTSQGVAAGDATVLWREAHRLEILARFRLQKLECSPGRVRITVQMAREGPDKSRVQSELVAKTYHRPHNLKEPKPPTSDTQSRPLPGEPGDTGTGPGSRSPISKRTCRGRAATLHHKALSWPV